MSSSLMRNLRTALIPLTLLLSACALESDPAPLPAPAIRSSTGETWIRTELYFGLAVPPGPDGRPAGQVSEDDWQRFLDEEITPRFPEGLTILEAGGQWRSRASDGLGVEIVHEQSRVVVILHRGDAAELADLGSSISSEDEKIEAVRAAYKRRFRQDSVLRTDSVLHVRF
jgi:hypothetical protein